MIYIKKLKFKCLLESRGVGVALAGCSERFTPQPEVTTPSETPLTALCESGVTQFNEVETKL